MSTNIKAENIKAWALVASQYGDVLAFGLTRESVREEKRYYNLLGVDTKIAKLTVEKFCR